LYAERRERSEAVCEAAERGGVVERGLRRLSESIEVSMGVMKNRYER
jgi:hypothetical protein